MSIVHISRGMPMFQHRGESPCKHQRGNARACTPWCTLRSCCRALLAALFTVLVFLENTMPKPFGPSLSQCSGHDPILSQGDRTHMLVRGCLPAVGCVLRPQGPQHIVVTPGQPRAAVFLDRLRATVARSNTSRWSLTGYGRQARLRGRQRSWPRRGKGTW